MRTYDEFIAEYAKSHRNLLNQKIHLICVPAIFFATVGLFWSVSLPVSQIQALANIPTFFQSWFNLAFLFFIPMFGFYRKLGSVSVLTGLLWTLISVIGCLWIESSSMSLAWTCAAVWVVAWAFQFYGHYVEGVKPSFGDDIVFLLIGPLFVQKKFNTLFQTGSIQAMWR